jgi:hypothetical protein
MALTIDIPEILKQDSRGGRFSGEKRQKLLEHPEDGWVVVRKGEVITQNAEHGVAETRMRVGWGCKTLGSNRTLGAQACCSNLNPWKCADLR